MRWPPIVTLALAAALALNVGCFRKQPSTTPEYQNVLGGYESDGDGESLFRGDAAVLSDIDIERILAFDLELGGVHRVAVLGLGRVRAWSEEDLEASETNRRAFLDRLSASSAIASASQLPPLLIPDKKSVPFLREAAARFQADLLLVYEVRVRTFSKYRTLGKDEVKALCMVDAVLLDVRSGIVPFTTSATEAISATKTAEEMNFSETVARTTAVAVGNAMLEVADATVAFLRGDS